MAIAKDASSPASASTWTSSTAGTFTTGAFSPPAGSWVYVIVTHGYYATNASSPAYTVKDSLNNNYTAGPSAYDTQYDYAGVYSRYYSSAPGSITVTATRTGTARAGVFVLPAVLTGVASSQSGAGSSTAYSASNVNYATGSITTTATGSWVLAAAGIGTANVTVSPNAATSNLQVWGDSTDLVTGAAGKNTSPTGTPGAVTLGWTWTGTATSFGWAALEVLPASDVTPAAVVQSKRVTGTHTVTLDTPTTEHNTLYLAYAGTSGGSGTPSVTGVTLGGSADHFAAQVSQAQGTQSYAVSAIWQDADCAAGQTAVAVTGSNLVAADALIYVVEVSGMGPAPVLEKSSTGPLSAGTTWTSNASGATAAGGGFVLGVTAHGPDRSSDSLAGPASPWTNCAQFQWSGGAAIAGYQCPVSAGSYTYSGTSSTSDYYTAVVTAFAPSVGTYAPAAAADAAGGAPDPALSLGMPAFPDPAEAASGADDATAGTSFTAAAAAAAGAGAGFTAAAVISSPAAATVTADAADAAGLAADEGLAPSGTGTAWPGAAAGAGTGPDPGITAAVQRSPAAAAGAGTAADAAALAVRAVAPAAAEAAGGALPAVAYTLGIGQAAAGVADGAADIPAASIFAYAQPVYLGMSGGCGRPRPLPGGSQVSVAPPGGGQPVYLGSLGHVQDLAYSFVMPGGCDKLTCTLKLPASLRSGVLTAGWHVRVHRGGHVVWTGRLDEPQPGPGGWTVTAVGDGQRGNDFTAIYTGWPSGQPDDLVSQAITRGLGWVNPGVGQPAWLWTGQQPDPGSQSVASVLTQLCSRGGGTWYVDSQPSGRPRLSLLQVPDDPDRLLLVTVPVPRTLAPLVNRLVLRYQSSADNTDTGAVAAYGTTTVTSTADVAVHDVTESYLDLSSAGVMSAAAAQAAGTSLLSLYRAAAYAGPFTAAPGQLLTAAGVPVDPGCDQAGHVVRLILSDFGYGGEVTPAVPVQFCVGGYSWDDQAGTATITPWQAAGNTLADLASAITGK